LARPELHRKVPGGVIRKSPWRTPRRDGRTMWTRQKLGGMSSQRTVMGYGRPGKRSYAREEMGGLTLRNQNTVRGGVAGGQRTKGLGPKKESDGSTSSKRKPGEISRFLTKSHEKTGEDEQERGKNHRNAERSVIGTQPGYGSHTKDPTSFFRGWVVCMGGGPGGVTGLLDWREQCGKRRRDQPATEKSGYNGG